MNSKKNSMPEKFLEKCLFPAAGYGTRFLPATKAMPKEMLPVMNKPLIQYGVEEARDAGLTKIAFVTGRGKRAIEDHFDKNYELEHEIAGKPAEKRLAEIKNLVRECTFSYTRQTEILGLGHAVLTGETLIGDEPFAVLLADDLCISDGKGVLSEMRALFEKYGRCIIAVEEVEKESVSNYGIVEGNLVEDDVFEVTKMIEKPDPNETESNLAIIGRYILTADVFNILRKTKAGAGGEIQLTDALNQLAGMKNVLAYRIGATRFDCGNVDGYVAATNWFYQRLVGKNRDT